MYLCIYVCMDFQFSVCVYNLCVSKCFSTKIKNCFIYVCNVMHVYMFCIFKNFPDYGQVKVPLHVENLF